jgi:hypothetical protein
MGGGGGGGATRQQVWRVNTARGCWWGVDFEWGRRKLIQVNVFTAATVLSHLDSVA